MILVTSPQKPIELTNKGTPRRNVAIKNYSFEIDEIYALVDGKVKVGE
jgi:hypothetical protein